MAAKQRYLSMFWGLVLVLVGIAFLLNRGQPFRIENPWLAVALTGILSAAFFVTYFIYGVEHWGWLFPATILAGVTLTIFLGAILPVQEGGWIAAPVLLGIAAPFVVVYRMDREKNAWALIPAYVMAAITLIAGLADLIPGELIGTLVLLLIALPFLVVYLRNRSSRWALIPFGVLATISIIPALASENGGELVAPVLLIAGGLILLYLSYRRRA